MFLVPEKTDMSDSTEQPNLTSGGSDTTSYVVDSASDGTHTPDVTEELVCVSEGPNATSDIAKHEPENLGNIDAATEEGKILAGAVGGPEVNCDICENNKAIMYCQNCPGYLCNQCYKSHKTSKMWKNHTYIDISVDQNLSVDLSRKQGDSSNENEVEIKCQEHVENSAVKICKSCIASICIQCDAAHETHEVVDLDPENYRNLQAICFDNVQIVLEYISKLETLSEDEGTTKEHEVALKHLITIQDKFLNMSRTDFDELIKRFESDKIDTIDIHSKKLACIKNTLSEATCILSKLHSVCTSSKTESLKNGLGYFYERIGKIQVLHNRLTTIKEKYPDISKERYIQQRICSLLNMLTFGHCYSSQYDNLSLDFTRGFYGVSHLLPTSYPEIVYRYTSSSKVVHYTCKSKEKVKETTIDTDYLVDVILLEKDEVLFISKEGYRSTNTTLSRVSNSTTLPEYDTFCVWGEKQLLFLSRKEEKFTFSVFATDTNKRTQLFSTDKVKYNKLGPIRLQVTKNVILVFTAVSRQCILHCFTKSGDLENTINLSFIPDLYFASCACVDEDDNVLIGSPNGNVYLLDYQQLRYKKIVSVPISVLKISFSNNMLCVVYRYTDLGQNHKCHLNVYSIDTK